MPSPGEDGTTLRVWGRDAWCANHQRPKLERYDDTLFTVFKTIHYVEHAELTAT
ncbi:hypothetical protein OHT61_28765 [Streptomyces sp. NBC_00178]|uniref:hypothetical protein n=1 Tax=Streptomyces sp. NBC_00178 TaxID=2975672 RepID=UPI002E28F2A3|nr:hypothetical protein [Streptomyces sp. NBC_00178]